MNARTVEIFDHLASLGDPTRTRTLLLLDGHELTVTELCGIMQLPQSTVSRHLKALADAGWITSRAEGTSHLYTMARPPSGAGRARPDGRDAVEPAARRLWQLVREQIAPGAAAAQDHRRLQAAIAARRTKSQEFFSSSAGQWDRLRDEQFGDRFHLSALTALADPEWTVGDLGCGTGRVSAAVAPFVARVIAVDGSTPMLQAAKKRLHGIGNVELRRGELEALPIDAATLDAATLMLVLHHVPEPERAIDEVARVVKPGGRVLVVDMLPHDRESYRQQMGHVWLGFGEAQVVALLTGGGFADVRVVALPPDRRAKGPALFAAAARKRAAADYVECRNDYADRRNELNR
jgi:ArsR family transcriptional regulator